MFAHLYQNLVLKNPKVVFILLLVAILSFGYYSKDFRLDASSETLLIEGDPDLAYLKEITERYGSKDFLILTYTRVIFEPRGGGRHRLLPFERLDSLGVVPGRRALLRRHERADPARALQRHLLRLPV